MPKLYIPSIGDELTLSKEWEFSLYDEYRNETLLAFLRNSSQLMLLHEKDAGHPIAVYTARLPAGARLEVDRVYVRKNMSFASISFKLVGEKAMVKPAANLMYISEAHRKGMKRPVRFWAKLEDVNNIEFL